MPCSADRVRVVKDGWIASALRPTRVAHQSLPEVSRDLLIPARAAPSCVRPARSPGFGETISARREPNRRAEDSGQQHLSLLAVGINDGR